MKKVLNLCNSLVFYQGRKCFLNVIPYAFHTNVEVNEYLKDRKTNPTIILQKLNDSEKEKLSQIKSMYQDLVLLGEIPAFTMSDTDYLECLTLGKSGIKKYMIFCANKFKKKTMKKKTKKPFKDPERSENMRFLCVYNSFLQNSLRTMYLNRLLNAYMCDSQKIVFDMSFEDIMTRREIKETARQFLYSFSILKRMKDPFQVIMTSVNSDGCFYNDLKGHFCLENGRIDSLDDYPIKTTDKSFIDILPKEKLIYLTPDSNVTLNQNTYDHDCIYVIGGIVDRKIRPYLSLCKARKAGIRHAKLPLDVCGKWKMGKKSLPLNVMIDILSVARDTDGDWKKAMQLHLSSRKIDIV